MGSGWWHWKGGWENGENGKEMEGVGGRYFSHIG